MKIMAVDPGEKRLGLAISDGTASLARPLAIIPHLSLKKDAARIIMIAHEEMVELIIIGAAYGIEGEETPATRHAKRLKDEVGGLTQIPCILWDESNSTKRAQAILVEMNVGRKRRSGHQDDLAATGILQSYLDTPEALRPDAKN